MPQTRSRHAGTSRERMADRSQTPASWSATKMRIWLPPAHLTFAELDLIFARTLLRPWCVAKSRPSTEPERAASIMNNSMRRHFAGTFSDFAAVAVARGNRPAADDIGGAACHSNYPRRIEPERDPDRRPDRTAVDVVRFCRGARLAFDCAAWHPRAALVVGLGLTAIGGALRGALPDIGWLYAMTIAMGAGVAIMQVSMPPAVRAWLPHRIGFATAVYTNGLLIGEILPVALMLHAGAASRAAEHWQWGFVIWSVPVAVIAVLVMTLAPRATLPQMGQPHGGAGGRIGATA